MELSIEHFLLVVGLLLFVSIVAGKTTYKFGVPTLLLFLVIGMLAGSEGIGQIYFDNPKLAQSIGVVALNFILFSGGLDTNWKAVRPIFKEGIALSMLGVLLTAFTLGAFIYFITDFSIYESMLLGSIVSSTDAAAVFSILRSKSLTLRSNLRPTLELESGSNDPMAYVLTISFLTLVINPEASTSGVIFLFISQMVIGALAGLFFGWLSKTIINSIKLDYEGLYIALVIALMFIIFSATDAIGGNGYLAIYLSALYLGNSQFIHKKTILKMYDGLAWLNQIVLFLTLGLLVFPSKVYDVLGVGLIISAFLIIVARPLSVFISLIPFKMEMRRRWYISWVGLRGAVPIVFATYPLLAGIEKADMIFNIVFFISVSSVLVQGTSLPFVARLLGVSDPETAKPLSETESYLAELPKTVMREFPIDYRSFAVDKKIVELDFPKNAIIAMIKRGDFYITPNGSTTIEESDVLIVLTGDQSSLDEVQRSLNHAT